MSYILDALKKLEKERKRGRIPGLSEQDSVVYHSQRRPVWPYILIAVFILNAALLLWWFLPKKQQDHPVPAALSVQPATTPSAEPPAALSSPPAAVRLPEQDVKRPEIREADHVVSPARKESAPLSRPQASLPVKDKDKSKDKDYHERLLTLRKMLQEDAQKSAVSVKNEPKADSEKQKESPAAPQEKKQEVAADPLPEKKLYKISELPPSIRGGLPIFSITAFLYSEKPSGRMARINERMMREGQVLEPGIRVEEIVSDGVILSYKKFHFFVSLK